MNKLRIIVAIAGALAVGLGAFGAHGLKPYLDLQQLETYKTASLYHFIHVLAMLICTLFQKQNPTILRSFYFFMVGIILFCGSLYVISTKHLYGDQFWNFLGPFTPLGGLFFILGWLNLIFVRE